MLVVMFNVRLTLKVGVMVNANLRVKHLLRPHSFQLHAVIYGASSAVAVVHENDFVSVPSISGPPGRSMASKQVVACATTPRLPALSARPRHRTQGSVDSEKALMRRMFGGNVNDDSDDTANDATE